MIATKESAMVYANFRRELTDFMNIIYVVNANKLILANAASILWINEPFTGFIQNSTDKIQLIDTKPIK
jgi:hypothetical protein